jgi:hypothetical protein
MFFTKRKEEKKKKEDVMELERMGLEPKELERRLREKLAPKERDHVADIKEFGYALFKFLWLSLFALAFLFLFIIFLYTLGETLISYGYPPDVKSENLAWYVTGIYNFIIRTFNILFSAKLPQHAWLCIFSVYCMLLLFLYKPLRRLIKKYFGDGFDELDFV